LIVALAAVIASTAGIAENRVKQATIGYIYPGVYGISTNEYLGGSSQRAIQSGVC
jgi:hypothetical protein